MVQRRPLIHLDLRFHAINLLSEGVTFAGVTLSPFAVLQQNLAVLADLNGPPRGQ